MWYCKTRYLLPKASSADLLNGRSLHLGIGGIGMGAFMGMAGLKGMLRRTLYFDGEYNLYMILAAICGGLLLLAFLAFFYNIVMSIGINGVLGIFKKSTLDKKELVPAAK